MGVHCDILLIEALIMNNIPVFLQAHMPGVANPLVFIDYPPEQYSQMNPVGDALAEIQVGGIKTGNGVGGKPVQTYHFAGDGFGVEFEETVSSVGRGVELGININHLDFNNFTSQSFCVTQRNNNTMRIVSSILPIACWFLRETGL